MSGAPGLDAAAMEGRHAPGDDPAWHEVWEVDLALPDGSLAAELSLAVWPASGRAWCRAAVLGEGRPLVTVVEHEAAAPRGTGLDLRAEALWADQICETPLEHWTVGLEAFGVALDDPAEALSGCRGIRTALGFDLEWESRPDDVSLLGDGAYELPCTATGEILLGAEELVVDGAWGTRRHWWGTTPPVAGGRAWGRTAEGAAWSGPAEVVIGADHLPVTAVARPSTTGPVELRAVHHAPVALPGGGRLLRSLAVAVADDGPGGWAWLARDEPGR